VQGLSPVMLSSGKYDVSHYQNMWRELDESASWSGELQCQHKSGATIFEWLTVNAVKGEDGILTGYHFIFSDRFERQVNEEKFRQLSLYDTLTRLPNRAMFADRINELLAESKKLALLCFNIDRFTEINNVLGVGGGDKALFAFAQRILSRVDAQDLVCRLGGMSLPS
jgi:predicted signal transduction protein with EAL and GGDEF domain